jgi:hypothetical protein
VSHPPDTIVSYMNKAKGSTFTSSAKALGFKGLWGGLVPRTIMIGTLTALQWFIYDVVKVTFSLHFLSVYSTFCLSLLIFSFSMSNSSLNYFLFLSLLVYSSTYSLTFPPYYSLCFSIYHLSLSPP